MQRDRLRDYLDQFGAVNDLLLACKDDTVYSQSALVMMNELGKTLTTTAHKNTFRGCPAMGLRRRF